MHISEQQIGRVWVVTPRGRLDGATSGTFELRIHAVITGPDPRLLVDLANVEFISSVGLRVLLSLVKKVKAAKGALALCAVQAPVREVFDVAGFSGMIDIHSERATALAVLS
jgi:anti-anti-sigma factor